MNIADERGEQLLKIAEKYRFPNPEGFVKFIWWKVEMINHDYAHASIPAQRRTVKGIIKSVCGHYSMKNGRCRYHGGKSTGARTPHRPLKHGRYTKEAIQERKEVAELLKDAKSLLGEMNEIVE